jgi:hypothetical protein
MEHFEQFEQHLRHSHHTGIILGAVAGSCAVTLIMAVAIFLAFPAQATDPIDAITKLNATSDHEANVQTGSAAANSSSLPNVKTPGAAATAALNSRQ